MVLSLLELMGRVPPRAPRYPCSVLNWVGEGVASSLAIFRRKHRFAPWPPEPIRHNSVDKHHRLVPFLIVARNRRTAVQAFHVTVITKVTGIPL